MNKAKLTFTTAFLALLLLGPVPYQDKAFAISTSARLNILATTVEVLKAEVEMLKNQSSTLKQVIGFDEVCIEYPAPSPVTIYTVPAGKTFILTDVEFQGTGPLILRQIASTSKIIIKDTNSKILHFQSGYNFPAGSQLQFSIVEGCVYVSGYLTTN